MERSAQRKNTDELLVAASFFIFFARFDSDVTLSVIMANNIRPVVQYFVFVSKFLFFFFFKKRKNEN